MILHERDSGHWANVGCQAWWNTMPGEAYGTFWEELANQSRFKLSLYSGSGGRPWSNSLHRGALGDATLGPFVLGSSTWYGTSNFDITKACPKAGTVAMWLCPATAIASNAIQCIFHQGTSGGSGTGLFNMLASTTALYCGWQTNNQENRALVSMSTNWWNSGVWFHVVFTWAIGDYCRAYINGGAYTATGSYVVSNYTTTGVSGLTYLADYPLSGGPYSYKGGINDFNIWAYQMSAAQVARAYNESFLGWPDRMMPSQSLRIASSVNTYLFSGIGGMFQGGYPDRTSSWIRPAIGGMTDGGHANRSNEFATTFVGGVRDGGNTASPLAWDKFAGIAPTLLTVHQPNDGGFWLKHPSYTSGDARLDGVGDVYSTTTNFGVFLHSWAPPSADYTVSCDCIRGGGGGSSLIGVGARWDSSANTGYYAYASNIGPTIYLSKVVAGSSADLATASIPWTAGQSKRLSLSVIGSSLRVYWDGVLKLGPVTDSSIASAGRAGLVTFNANVSAHDWMSTGGGVQARFVPTPSGGEAQGGFYSSGSFWAWSGSGGLAAGGHLDPVKAFSLSSVGGFEIGGKYAGPTYTYIGAGGVFQGAKNGFSVTFRPPIAGGIRDGGHAIWASGWVLAATGGMRDGGHTSAGNNVYIEVGVGGILIGSTAKTKFQGRHKATGGMAQSGVASWVKTYFATPSGGMRHGGYVAVTKTVVISALASQIHGGVVLGLSRASLLFGSGGMDQGSEPTPSQGTTCYASGGFAAGGEGDQSVAYRPEATGGMSESGVPLPSRSMVAFGSGGLRDGGSKRAVMGFAPSGSGGLSAGGEPIPGHATLFVGAGGLDRGGQTIDLMAFGPEASGGMIQSAETQFVLDYVNAFSGGIDQAAIAPNTLDSTSSITGGGLSHGGRASPVPTAQIREAIFNRLVTSPQIMASTGGRIYFGGLPQTCRLEDGPAIVFFIVSRSYGRSLSGPNGTSIARVHLAACSFDEAETDRLTQLIRHRFQGFAGLQYGQLILSCKLENDLDIPEAPVAGTDQWVYQVGTEYSISHRVRIPSFVPRPS